MAQNMDEVLEKMKEIYKEFEQLTINSYNIGRRDEREEIKNSESKPEIEIGAIIRGDFCNGVITKIDNAYDEVCVLWHDGEVSTETFGWTKKYLTGRKIKGLNGVLDEINEEND